MKKRFLPFLVILLCCNLQIACSDDAILEDEMALDTEETGDNDNEEISDDSNDDVSEASRIELTADRDILTNNGQGEQAWNYDVFLTAKKINGDAASIVYESRFRDNGFGVAGGRWEQIDYYYEYQGEIVETSEQLIVNFRIPVKNVILQVGQMDPDEGRQAKEGTICADNDTIRVDESGKWTAYDADGKELATGILLDEFSLEGKLPDSMGSYRFQLNVENISKLVIEATQWGGQERGCPTSRSGYADEPLNDSGNTENNSEFNLMALSYVKG